MDGMLPKPKQKPEEPVVEEKIEDPEFTPPEKLVEEDDVVDTDTGPTIKLSTKKSNWWTRLSKKKKIIILVSAAVLLLGGGIAAFFLLKKPAPKPTPTPVVQKVEEAPKPTTVAGKLTGDQISPELNARGVTGVMIENSIDARPQAGLLQAGVVYEAIAEGGITRFLALFHEAQPDYIGPVRSARPYYINWLLPYNASYMHIGGSGEALQMIRNLNVRDMGENSNNNPISRVSNRYAPHNAYTSMAKMDAVRTSKGWGNPDFTGLARKEAAPLKTPLAITIDLAISSSAFNVHYDYDAATNNYKRSEGGQKHIDEKTAAQLNPKVVVALIIPYSINPDGVHSNYASVGSGQAFVFQDGNVQDVRWSKPAATSPLTIVDAAGAAVPINPGQTWFTALGLSSMVKFTAPAPAPVPAGP